VSDSVQDRVKAAPSAAGEEVLDLLLADEQATVELGRRLGELLRAGDVVLLSGELGAGKTVLARGLALGLGVDENYAIVSPSFTLLNVYPGRLAFYHADLYRLGEDEARDLELLDQAADGVLAVEWAQRAGSLWPPGCLEIELKLEGQRQRRARLAGPARILKSLAEKDQAAADNLVE